MIIGICGKSGCGKSTLAREIIQEYNDRSIHLDIDKVGHKVLFIEEVQKELVANFGENIINHGKVDRKRLGRIVFASREEMQKLSDITWKYMQIEIDNFLVVNKGKIIVLDWILLPNSKYFEMCDMKVLLDIPYEIRKQRAMKRDNITEEAFELREKASIEFDKNSFHYVIEETNRNEIKKMVKLI